MAKISRVALAAAITTAAACSSAASDADRFAEGDLSGDVVVLSAASLGNVFNDIAAAFTRAHPGVDVVLSVAASSSLAVSVEQGAPADVLASANVELMDALDAGGHLDSAARVFATNELTIAVPIDGDDEQVSSIADFARDELFLGACASQVPCGGYADEVFRRSGVEPAIDTRTSDVRGLVTLLIERELDAGMVYVTDAVANSDTIRALALDPEVAVAATYPIAVLSDAPNPVAARRFVEFVAGDEAQQLLADAGFGSP